MRSKTKTAILYLEKKPQEELAIAVKGTYTPTHFSIDNEHPNDDAEFEVESIVMVKGDIADLLLWADAQKGFVLDQIAEKAVESIEND